MINVDNVEAKTTSLLRLGIFKHSNHAPKLFRSSELSHTHSTQMAKEYDNNNNNNVYKKNTSKGEKNPSSWKKSYSSSLLVLEVDVIQNAPSVASQLKSDNVL